MAFVSLDRARSIIRSVVSQLPDRCSNEVTAYFSEWCSHHRECRGCYNAKEHPPNCSLAGMRYSYNPSSTVSCTRVVNQRHKTTLREAEEKLGELVSLETGMIGGRAARNAGLSACRVGCVKSACERVAKSLQGTCNETIRTSVGCFTTYRICKKAFGNGQVQELQQVSKVLQEVIDLLLTSAVLNQLKAGVGTYWLQQNGC
mmetsp:Transcript_140997/g.438329  ORF Transcript_140997/g.438329 Transcript_140997/m.438329 type:complete len:202 (+) Transcript_140997:103-708(+)